MNETRFLALMMKARKFSGLGEHSDYWHGYQRGLKRGFQGELFGTDAEHKLWMRLADDGPDIASRERGRGYRDGLGPAPPRLRTACLRDHRSVAAPIGKVKAIAGYPGITGFPGYSGRR